MPPPLPIWFLGEFVEFQPNDYDKQQAVLRGLRLFVLRRAQALWQGLSRLKAAGPRRCLAGASLGLCCCAAVLTMGRETVARYVLFDPGAIALSAYLEEELPADALVLTDSRHNNEVASLAGRGHPVRVPLLPLLPRAGLHPGSRRRPGRCTNRRRRPGIYLTPGAWTTCW